MTEYRKEIENRIKETLEKELTKEVITRAYYNVSMTPEDKYKGEHASFKYSVFNVFDVLVKDVREDNRDIFISLFDKFYVGYVSRNQDRLRALQNCFSVLVTGGGNFNTKRHQVANDRERRASDLQAKYIEKMVSYIKKALKKTETIDDMRDKLEVLKKKQAANKEFNKLLRKETKEFIEGAIESLSVDADQLEDFKFRLEYSYKADTTNILNRIKTLEAKIKRTKEFKEKENEEISIKGGKIVTNYEVSRYQVLFDEKPDKSVIQELKRLGFRWSPKNMAWQQFLTPNGTTKVKEFLQRVNP